MLVGPNADSPCVRSAAGSTHASSAEKAIALLVAFDDGSGHATLTELARAAGVPKSTAHRLLNMLREGGLIQRAGMDWHLASPVLRLGALALGGEASLLREVAVPHMIELHNATQANVHLAMLDGSDTVYLEKIYGHRSAPSPSRVGHRVPSHTTALGKAILALSDGGLVEQMIARGLRPRTPHSIVRPEVFRRHLIAVKNEGVAFDREECRQGLSCVAAPIIAPSGRPVAAISVAGASRTIKESVLTPKLLAAAAEIARRSGPDIELLSNAS